MVGGLRDVEEVGDQAAHEVAGAVAVKEREALAHVGVEEVLAHAALHARDHDVAPVDDEVTAHEAQRVHGDEADGDVGQHAEDGVRALREQAAGKTAQYLREREVHRRDRDGGGDVRHEEMQLASVVGEKAFEHGATPSSGVWGPAH